MKKPSIASLCILVVGVFSQPLWAADNLTHYTPPEMAALGFPFSSAVRHGNTLYLSGVIGTKPGKSEVVDGGIAEETKAAMGQIGQTLAAFDLDYSDLVKCTAFLADMSEWPGFNDVYKGYFGAGPFPARSAFGVSGLALNARLEIECIAAIP